MNWIKNTLRPKVNAILKRRDTPDNVWIKCPETGRMSFYKDVEDNQWVIPESNYHLKMPVEARLASLFDENEYDSISTELPQADPLKFVDRKKFKDRYKEACKNSGSKESVTSAFGRLYGIPTTISVHDPFFLAGTLGMGTGESIISAIEYAFEKKTPYIMVTSSGGARLQHGALALMQMPRTLVALRTLKEASLPYIVVFTNPTTGGVTASYAMMGDIHIGEPGAMIGFAGPRVIQQTIRQELPEGFQTSEFLFEHGMLDMIVHRHDLKTRLGTIIKLLLKAH